MSEAVSTDEPPTRIKRRSIGIKKKATGSTPNTTETNSETVNSRSKTRALNVANSPNTFFARGRGLTKQYLFTLLEEEEGSASDVSTCVPGIPGGNSNSQRRCKSVAASPGRSVANAKSVVTKASSEDTSNAGVMKDKAVAGPTKDGGVAATQNKLEAMDELPKRRITVDGSSVVVT